MLYLLLSTYNFHVLTVTQSLAKCIQVTQNLGGSAKYFGARSATWTKGSGLITGLSKPSQMFRYV